MTQEEKQNITEISKDFASAFKDTIGEIAGSGWLIVDPLSGYLNSCGIENTLKELPATKNHPQILIMIFSDGTQFIPAGSDLKSVVSNSHDWFWIDKK